MSLAGKVAIVTGSGRGLGLAYAQELARQGAAVIINDVDAATAADAVASIETVGGTASAVVAPVGPTETPALQVGYNGDGTPREGIEPGLACPEPVDLEVVIGKTIAWGTETSTSGYIFPTLELIRKGITEDQYTELQTASGEDLTGVLNPLDRENFRGGQPLKDDAFRSGFQSLLDPAQSEKLQASLDEQAAKAAEPGAPADPGNISNLPAMELEKLDETVVSAKKLTGGLKQMMEGMGGLQDLGPLMEQQRQRRNGGAEPAPQPAE